MYMYMYTCVFCMLWRLEFNFPIFILFSNFIVVFVNIVITSYVHFSLLLVIIIIIIIIVGCFIFDWSVYDQSTVYFTNW